jgi:hypothetical protein
MPIPVVCSCSAKLKVGDHLKGKHIKCPKCGSLIPVGVANGTPAAPAPVKPPPSSKAVLEQSSLSESERDAVEGELDKGERLVWADKPDVRTAFLRGFIVTAALGSVALVMFIVLIVLIVAMGFKDTGGVVVFLILGAIFLAALGGAIAAPYANRWRMSKVFYAFTTKRALAWNCAWSGKIALNVYEPADMAKLYRQNLSRGEDGVGNLIFGVSVQTKKTREGNVQTFTRYGFFMIPRAATVEKMLRETLLDPFLDKLYE